MYVCTYVIMCIYICSNNVGTTQNMVQTASWSTPVATAPSTFMAANLLGFRGLGVRGLTREPRNHRIKEARVWALATCIARMDGFGGFRGSV